MAETTLYKYKVRSTIAIGGRNHDVTGYRWARDAAQATRLETRFRKLVHDCSTVQVWSSECVGENASEATHRRIPSAQYRNALRA